MTNVLKLSLTHVLDEFDLKLVDPVTGRPKNSTEGNFLYPDREAGILVRRRR